MSGRSLSKGRAELRRRPALEAAATPDAPLLADGLCQCQTLEATVTVPAQGDGALGLRGVERLRVNSARWRDGAERAGKRGQLGGRLLQRVGSAHDAVPGGLRRDSREEPESEHEF